MISTSCYTQEKYHFDYLIKYKTKTYENDSVSKKKILYYLTNSKDNSYIATLKKFDSTYFELELSDQNGLYSNVKVLIDSFFKAEFINIDCENVIPYENHFKFRTKTYNFLNLSDTILLNRKLKKYKLYYTGRKRKKKSFPVGTNYYLIEDSTSFHLPILTHPTAYEEWKTNKFIPKGIFAEKIFYNYKNKIENIMILQDYYQIDKKIVIPAQCNYSE